jgi:hypothetical protein
VFSITQGYYESITSFSARLDTAVKRTRTYSNPLQLLTAFGDPENTFFGWQNLYENRTIVTPKGDHTTSIIRLLQNGGKKFANLYLVEGGSTVEISFSKHPKKESMESPEVPEKEEWVADVYRFDTATTKWTRLPNRMSKLSALSKESEYIAYHASPHSGALDEQSYCE